MISTLHLAQGSNWGKLTSCESAQCTPTIPRKGETILTNRPYEGPGGTVAALPALSPKINGIDQEEWVAGPEKTVAIREFCYWGGCLHADIVSRDMDVFTPKKR